MSVGPGTPAGRLGLGLATVLVAGNLIGSGIYLLPATLATIGSISIFGWVIAAIGALVLAGVFSLMMIVRPTEDGLADIVRAALGPYWGFQSSLLYWLACWLANIAIALAVVGYLTVPFPVLDQPLSSAAATVAVIWLLTGIAMLGPRAIGRTHTLTLAVGLVPLLAVGVLGWLWFDPQLFARSWNVSGQPASGAVFGSLVSVFWAFVGVECAAMVARMVQNPARNVPLATMGGVGIAALVYMFASTAIFGMVPAERLASSSAPFALAVDGILGPAAAGLVAMCAILKASGTLGGWVLVTGEATRWTAASGFLPKWLAQTSDTGMPVRALVAMAVLMSVATFLTTAPTIARQFELLINASVVFNMLVYVYASIALVRFTTGASRGRRMAALILAVLAILFSVLLIVSAGSGLIAVTAGLVVLTLLGWQLVRQRVN
jgi:arginine:agmatine antiporter